jgi:NADH-quinone oxidoreductase subunit M
VIALLAIALTAGAYLVALRRTFLGAVPQRWQAIPDLSARELLTIVPLIVLTLIIGIAPSSVLDVIHTTTAGLSR